MDASAPADLTAQKQDLRRRLRAARRERYGEDPARRAREARLLLDRAAPLIDLVARQAAHRRAGGAEPRMPPALARCVGRRRR